MLSDVSVDYFFSFYCVTLNIEGKNSVYLKFEQALGLLVSKLMYSIFEDFILMS